MTATPAPASLTASGTHRAAVLLIALGTEAAGRVLKCLRDEEVERLSIEIARLRNVPADLVDDALGAFRDAGMGGGGQTAQGGVGFVRESLEQALGARRAEEVMMKVEAAMEVSAFHLLQAVDTGALVTFLSQESPQTGALILAHLNPRKAGDILAGLSPAMQEEVMFRLATLGPVSPELMRDVEDVIRQQIGHLVGGTIRTGGAESVAKILGSSNRSTERTVMDALRTHDAELAAAVKSHMFVFDDLVHISERDLQKLLMAVEQRDLALALKAAADEFKQKVMSNMSERAAQTIREEMELMGPARVSDVEDAQRRILEAAEGLEAQGEIVLSRAPADTLL